MKKPRFDVEAFDSPDELARAASEQFAILTRNRKPFRVALSGGSSPKAMYKELRSMDLDWSHIEIYWSDERMVSPDQEDSNEGMARRELIQPLHLAEERVFGIYASGDADQDACRYEAIVREFDGKFDLVLLGMGSDGHTASMFPGDPSVREGSRWVVGSLSPVGVRDRVTFTTPLIARSSHVLVLVSGPDKAGAWQEIKAGAHLPLGRVLNRCENAQVLACFGRMI